MGYCPWQAVDGVRLYELYSLGRYFHCLLVSGSIHCAGLVHG